MSFAGQNSEDRQSCDKAQMLLRTCIDRPSETQFAILSISLGCINDGFKSIMKKCKLFNFLIILEIVVK